MVASIKVREKLVLRTMGRIEKVSDFADLIVTDRKDYPVV